MTVLRFAFHQMNLNRVSLEAFESNERALACYRKCGFREEGRLRQDRFKHGRYYDTIVMGVLRKEFEVWHNDREMVWADCHSESASGGRRIREGRLAPADASLRSA
jgi:hypothetical protein